MAHFMQQLKERFPRLQAVSFTECEKDEYTVESTPAGQVETVYFYERSDFEKAVIALAYNNEPLHIPVSMGAIFISGLLDHAAGKKTAMVLLSRGGYSGITGEDLKAYCADHGIDGPECSPAEHRNGNAEETENCAGNKSLYENMSQAEWEDFSLTIRKNHELAHFVQRKLFPENKDILKDEIKADMTGIIEAFGTYDGFLARLFLGIEGSSYRQGGRLENYVSSPDQMEQACIFAESYITSLEDKLRSQFGIRYSNGAGFDILMEIEKSEKSETKAET